MSVVKRILGVLLVIVSIVSLVLSLAGIVGVWSLRTSLANAVNTGLTLVDDTLASTNDALTKVDVALGTTATNVAAAQGTFQSLAATVDSTTPALGSLSKFLSDDLPETLDAAQKTLSGAADSAKVVDGVLSLLSDLPLFNIDYNPEVSLSESLGGIGGSLEGLPDTLGQLGKQLAGPANTLPALARSLDTLGISISQLETTLTDFQGVVGSYQDLINRYRSMIQSLQAAMLRLVTIVPLMVTFFLFWLAMLQLLVLIKGWHWLRGGNAKPEPVTVSAAPPAALPAAPVKVETLPAAAGKAAVKAASETGTENADTTGSVIAAAGDAANNG